MTMVLAWNRARGLFYWASVLLLLSTKEDAALYIASFAVVMLIARAGRTRRAVATLIVAIAWFGVAIGIGIPASREADGLTRRIQPIAERFGDDTGRLALMPLRGAVARRLDEAGDLR